jgi:SpoVK/Ycf46/Vps4 family AAA+-type ATPase
MSKQEVDSMTVPKRKEARDLIGTSSNYHPTQDAVPINWGKMDFRIEHEGKKFVLPADPENMPKEVAVETLQRMINDENQEFNINETFDAYPADAAVAMTKAMIMLHGYASPQTKHTWFGPRPPIMKAIKTGLDPDQVVTVPLGLFKLPGVDDLIETAINSDHGFIIFGTVKKSQSHIILDLAAKTREILAQGSIYKGRAIRVKLDDDDEIDLLDEPEYIDVRDIDESHLIFDSNVQDQIDTHLLTPIKCSDLCEQHKIPIGRKTMLEGPYGVGKTLLSRLVAHECEQFGWTYILLDKAQGLQAALEFAKRYQPAVVFVEDIDRLVSVGDEKRDQVTQDLTVTIDGVLSKTSKVMVVMTTNHIHKINPVMLRPGRVDAIISLPEPGMEACNRLLRFYSRGLLADNVILNEVCKVLVEGKFIPASIRECVERAKLSMIGRRDTHLVESDLLTSARSMSLHMKLLAPKTPDKSVGERLAEDLKASVLNGTSERIEAIEKQAKETKNMIIRVMHRIGA